MMFKNHYNKGFCNVLEDFFSMKNIHKWVCMFVVCIKGKKQMKDKVSKLTYPMLQYCLRILHIMHTTIMKGGICQSGSKTIIEYWL